jgi:hypothetical protein
MCNNEVMEWILKGQRHSIAYDERRIQQGLRWASHGDKLQRAGAERPSGQLGLMATQTSGQKLMENIWLHRISPDGWWFLNFRHEFTCVAMENIISLCLLARKLAVARLPRIPVVGEVGGFQPNDSSSPVTGSAGMYLILIVPTPKSIHPHDIFICSSWELKYYWIKQLIIWSRGHFQSTAQCQRTGRTAFVQCVSS